MTNPRSSKEDVRKTLNDVDAAYLLQVCEGNHHNSTQFLYLLDAWIDRKIAAALAAYGASPKS